MISQKEYSDYLDDEYVEPHYMVVMKPRRLADTSAWVLDSGTLYTLSFSFGIIVNVKEDDTTLTEASTSALSDGEWFYDPDTTTLYYDNSVDPSGKDVTLTYEIYLSTKEENFNRIPTDLTTREVHWNGVISQSPTLSQTNKDTLFGYFPITTSGITVINDEQFFNKHLGTSSFHLADCDLYQYFFEPYTFRKFGVPSYNVKFLISMKSFNHRYTDGSIVFELRSKIGLFDQTFDTPYRVNTGTRPFERYWDSTAYPNVDPNFTWKPRRIVFGYVDKIACVCSDYDLDPKSSVIQASPAPAATRTYVADASIFDIGEDVRVYSNASDYEVTDVITVNTSSNYIDHSSISTVGVAGQVVESDGLSSRANRTWWWGVGSGASHTGSLLRQSLIQASPAPTKTRTYVADASAFLVGETVNVHSASSTFESTAVTAVNTSSNYIDHEPVSTVGVASEKVAGGVVTKVFVYQDGKYYRIDKETVKGYTGGSNGSITFQDDFESGYAGLSTIDPSKDYVYVGARTWLSDDNSAYYPVDVDGDKAARDATYGTEVSGIMILLRVLKLHLLLDDDDLELTSWKSAVTNVTDKLGFCIPEGYNDTKMPTYSEVISRILASLMCRMYLTSDGKIGIEQIGPLGATDKTVYDYDFAKNSLSYDLSYDDLYTDTKVNYNPLDINQINEITSPPFRLTVRSRSDSAARLHDFNREYVFNSYHLDESEAQTLADRLKYYLGERRGYISFVSRNEFYEKELQDVLTVTRTKLPDNAYDGSTEFSQSGVIVSKRRGLRDVAITIDDQKGIEDNSGSW